MNWQNFIEIEDHTWFPHLLRNQITDALHYLIVEMKVYDPIIPELLWVMQHSRTKKVVDLCSGGTGPWQYLIKTIRNPEESFESITLTDLYPNREAMKALAAAHPVFNYRDGAVDALNIDPALEGVRTLFSSFHHFDRVQGIAILQNAVDNQTPICIFEFTERLPKNFLLPPISTLILFTKLLFKRPFTISKLLFSYLIPIVPAVYLWDSTLSHLRSYSKDELAALIVDVNNSESFVWETGERRSPKTHLKNIFLIGYPKT